MSTRIWFNAYCDVFGRNGENCESIGWVREMQGGGNRQDKSRRHGSNSILTRRNGVGAGSPRKSFAVHAYLPCYIWNPPWSELTFYSCARDCHGGRAIEFQLVKWGTSRWNVSVSVSLPITGTRLTREELWSRVTHPREASQGWRLLSIRVEKRDCPKIVSRRLNEEDSSHGFDEISFVCSIFFK